MKTPTPTLHRRDDWVARLAAELSEARNRPFRWTTHNCVLFPSACVRAMTGVDPAAGRRDYKNKAEAEAMVADAGGLAALAASALAAIHGHDCALDSPLLAGRGDVALIETTAGPTLGVVDFDGRHVLVPARPRGLARYRLTHATHAWRVG